MSDLRKKHINDEPSVPDESVSQKMQESIRMAMMFPDMNERLLQVFCGGLKIPVDKLKEDEREAMKRCLGKSELLKTKQVNSRKKKQKQQSKRK